MNTLSDVQRAVLAEETSYLGPMTGFVVNFVAPYPFPRKFVYRGCTVKTPKGMCKVSVEGPPEKHCEHNALGNGTHMELYRFEVVLSDDSLQSNYGKPTLRATIWEAASDLLGLSAPSLAGLDELEQLQHVHDCIQDIPRCKMTFWCRRGAVSIKELEIQNTSSTLPQSLAWQTQGTPRRLPQTLAWRGLESKLNSCSPLPVPLRATRPLNSSSPESQLELEYGGEGGQDQFCVAPTASPVTYFPPENSI